MTRLALAARLREALAEYDAQMSVIGSCSDGFCVVQKPVGMHTNGGCRCMTDHMKARRLGHAAQKFSTVVRTALEDCK